MGGSWWLVFPILFIAVIYFSIHGVIVLELMFSSWGGKVRRKGVFSYDAFVVRDKAHDV